MMKCNPKIISVTRCILAGLLLQSITIGVLSAEVIERQYKSIEEIFLTVNYRNLTLEEVFSRLGEETDFNFHYNMRDISGRNIDIRMRDASLGDILRYISGETGLYFERIGETIHVLPKGMRKERVIEDLSKLGQLRKVSGRVVSAEDSESLPGVNVLIKGTTQGTVTDVNGHYEIEVGSSQAVLVFSFVGFTSQEVTVGDRTTVDVTLSSEVATLDEVVVVGYGTMKKADLTGAISAIEGDEIAERNSVQISQGLQGLMPGVMVTRDNGAPGSPATIRVRGITTIGDSNPLILVDGVPTNDIDNVNPYDIESISVLKDAASASIYGSKAAAGVILIKTKRAKEGQLSLDFNYSAGIERPSEMPDFADAKRYMQMVNELRWNDIGNPAGNEFPVYEEAVINDYANLHAQNPDVYPDTDWMDILLKDKASRQSYLLNLSAGSEKSQSRVSLGYDEIDGLYIGKGFKRLTGRVNNNFEINKRLNATVDLHLRRAILEDPTVSPMTNVYRAAPVYAAVWSNGLIAEGKSGNNMYAQLLKGGSVNRWQNQLGGRISLDFEPVKNLTFTGVVAPTFNYHKGKEFRKKVQYTAYDDPNVYVGTTDWGGTTNLTETRTDFYFVTSQFLANYKKSVGKHNFEAMAGYENYYYHYESMGAFSNNMTLDSYSYLDLGNPNFLSNSGTAFENASRSYFGRINYNYNRKYLLQANVRFDGSSRFHSDYRWGSFPSVSAGWVLSEENFLQDVDVLSFLKVKASWGILGNERIGNYPYQATINFTDALLFQGTNVVSAQTAAQQAYAIQDISWETTESYNFGFDVGLLNDRLSLSADFYNKETRDMLLALEIPDYMGYDNPDQNTGKMHTKGWELTGSWNDTRGDFRYGVTLNISDSRSILDNLGGIQFLGDQVKLEGSEFNEWYGYRAVGIFQTQEEVDASPVLFSGLKPGDIRFEDVSGPDGVPDGLISEYDKVLLGGSLPRYIYGGNIQLGFRNFDFSLSFQGVGKQNSRLTANMVQPYLGSWGNMPMEIEGKYWSVYNTEEQNRNAVYPRLTSNFTSNNYAMSNFWLFNGSYFRLKNVVLGYTLPEQISKAVFLRNCRIYATASDILSFNKYPKGWDPEVANTGYPITATYTLGLSVKF